MDEVQAIDSNDQRPWLASLLMERPTYVSIFIGLLLVAAFLCNRTIGTAAQMPSPSINVAPTPSVETNDDSASTFDADADARAFEKDRREQMELEAKREQIRDSRNAAAAKMEQAREDQQYFGQPQWSEIIYKNLQTFRELRAAAAQPGKKFVECSICNGKSHLESCFLCGSTGKCHLCDGTGKRGFNETCPACQGSGHCFLCSGSGKMRCPFCDDGVISFSQHDPSPTIPTH